MPREVQEAWLLSREHWIDRSLNTCGKLLEGIKDLGTDEELDGWLKTVHPGEVYKEGSKKGNNPKANGMSWVLLQFQRYVEASRLSP